MSNRTLKKSQMLFVEILNMHTIRICVKKGNRVNFVQIHDNFNAEDVTYPLLS